MDGWHLLTPALTGGGGMGLIAYLALQWRLRQRDKQDHELRMAWLSVNPQAPVVDNLPALRRAEREIRVGTGRRESPRRSSESPKPSLEGIASEDGA